MTNGEAKTMPKSTDPTQDAIDAIEARRAARKATGDKERKEQLAKDLEALDALEVQHGDGRVARLTVQFFTPGLPTMVIVSTPSDGHFTRYRQQIRKAGQNVEAKGAAADMLASVCVAYPDEDTYNRMRKVYPAIHDSVYIQAAQLGQARTEDEGKG